MANPLLCLVTMRVRMSIYLQNLINQVVDSHQSRISVIGESLEMTAVIVLTERIVIYTIKLLVYQKRLKQYHMISRRIGMRRMAVVITRASMIMNLMRAEIRNP